MPGSGLNDAALTVAADALKDILLYAQLHSGPAGPTGMANICTPTRVPVTWGTTTGSGDFSLDAPLDFTGGTLSGPVYSVTLWSTGSVIAGGTAGTGGGSSGTPLSWTDTIPAGTNYAVVWVTHHPNTSSPGTTVTIGGSSAGSVSGSPLQLHISSWYYSLECFVLENPPTGAGKTITVAKTSGGNGFNAEAVYYSNVGSLGTLITTNGDSPTAPSMVVPNSKADTLYSQAFFYHDAFNGSNFYDYNQTQLYMRTGGVYYLPLIVGEAYGNGGSLTFNAKRNDSSGKWGGGVLPLKTGGSFYGEFLISGDKLTNSAGAYTVNSLSFDGSAS